MSEDNKWSIKDKLQWHFISHAIAIGKIHLFVSLSMCLTYLFALFGMPEFLGLEGSVESYIVGFIWLGLCLWKSCFYIAVWSFNRDIYKLAKEKKDDEN